MDEPTEILILKTTNIYAIRNWYGNLEIKQLDSFLKAWQILTSCQLVEVTVEGAIELNTVQ